MAPRPMSNRVMGHPAAPTIRSTRNYPFRSPPVPVRHVRPEPLIKPVPNAVQFFRREQCCQRLHGDTGLAPSIAEGPRDLRLRALDRCGLALILRAQDAIVGGQHRDVQAEQPDRLPMAFQLCVGCLSVFGRCVLVDDPWCRPVLTSQEVLSLPKCEGRLNCRHCMFTLGSARQGGQQLSPMYRRCLWGSAVLNATQLPDRIGLPKGSAQVLWGADKANPAGERCEQQTHGVSFRTRPRGAVTWNPSRA
jgi:hypothetical protein